MKHAKKQESMTSAQEKTINRKCPEEAQTLDFLGRNFKSAILNMSKGNPHLKN